jgi:hypothetical protein
LPRTRQGVEYRSLDEATPARQLFAFAAATLPAQGFDFGLGAWAGGSRLIGALLVERQGEAAMFWGPVVVPGGVAADGRPGGDDSTTTPPIEVAAELVRSGLDLVAGRGVLTVFTRPQGLERVWVRFGFIPVPETALPGRLRERPGAGLFAYRGGSALWSVRDTGSG